MDNRKSSYYPWGMVSLGYLWFRPYISEQLNKFNFQSFFLRDLAKTRLILEQPLAPVFR